MQISIKNYGLFYNCGMIGVDNPVKVEYQVVWDGPAGSPGEAEVTKELKRAVCRQINDIVGRGYIPVVSVFEPVNRAATLANIKKVRREDEKG